MLAAIALSLAFHAPVPYAAPKPPATPVLKSGTYVMLWNDSRYELRLDLVRGDYVAILNPEDVWVGSCAWDEKERLWQVEEVHQGNGTRLRWYVVLDEQLKGRSQGGTTVNIAVIDPRKPVAPATKTGGKRLPLPRPFPR